MSDMALTPSKPASPLLALPPEVRDCIFDAALNWPNLSDLAKTITSQSDATLGLEQPLCTIPRPRYEAMSTPSLLLLNRQITSEALEVLYRKPLILDSTLPYMPQLGRPMDIPEIISESTLQNLRFVVLRMDLGLGQKRSARNWYKTVEILLDIWLVKNNLEKLEVRVQWSSHARRTVGPFEGAAHRFYMKRLLSKVRLVEINLRRMAYFS